MDFTKIHVNFTKIHVDFNEIHVDFMKSTWILTCKITVDFVFEISLRIHVDFSKKKSQKYTKIHVDFRKSTWIRTFFFGCESTWILLNPRGFLHKKWFFIKNVPPLSFWNYHLLPYILWWFCATLFDAKVLHYFLSYIVWYIWFPD